MTPDQINGTFEFLGALSSWQGFFATIADRGYAGLRKTQMIFYFSWGIWNLYYYTNLQQTWSFVGGLNLVLANGLWVGAMLYYGKKV